MSCCSVFLASANNTHTQWAIRVKNTCTGLKIYVQICTFFLTLNLIAEFLIYRKVASSNTSAGFFRLLMNGICDPYVL